MTRLALIVASLVMSASQAPAQSQSFYDRNGSFAGSTIRSGNETFVYDRNGYAGRGIRYSDGTINFYDRHGRFFGSMKENQKEPKP